MGRSRSIALVFSTICDIITPYTYALKYVINYFVALYFGYVVKCPVGPVLGPFYAPMVHKRRQPGIRLTVRMRLDRPDYLVSGLKRMPGRLLLCPNYGTQEEMGTKNRLMKGSPKIRATRSLSTYINTDVEGVIRSRTHPLLS